MLPEFDKDLLKVVNGAVTLLPVKPDNELYQSFLEAADNSGFFQKLFRKSEKQDNRIAALSGACALIECISMWKMASFKNFSLEEFHNLFWTLSYQKYIGANGPNQDIMGTWVEVMALHHRYYKNARLPLPESQLNIQDVCLEIILSFIDSIGGKYKQRSINKFFPKLFSYWDSIDNYLETYWNENESKLLDEPNETIYEYIAKKFPLPIAYRTVAVEKPEKPNVEENKNKVDKVPIEKFQHALLKARKTNVLGSDFTFHFYYLLEYPHQTEIYKWPDSQDALGYKRDCVFLYFALVNMLDISGYKIQIDELAQHIGETRGTPDQLEENQKKAKEIFAIVKLILICYLPLYMKTLQGMLIAQQIKQFMLDNNPTSPYPQLFFEEFLSTPSFEVGRLTKLSDPLATDLLLGTEFQSDTKSINHLSAAIHYLAQSVSCALQDFWTPFQNSTEEDLSQTIDIEEIITKLSDPEFLSRNGIL